MARGTYQLLLSHKAKLFASVIPRAVEIPSDPRIEEYLRKDHVFLFERFFYFLNEQAEHGLVVMDQVEKSYDRRFVRRMEAYFNNTTTGRYRTQWIVPTPLFVSSDLTYPVQAADICIYCLNWGFRLPTQGMDAPMRQEVGDEFGPWLHRLQYQGVGRRELQHFQTWGIVFVPNPYAAGRA